MILPALRISHKDINADADFKAEYITRLVFLSFRFNAQFRQRAHDLHCFQAHCNDLSDEAFDVLRVVCAVRIVGDAASFVR